MSSNNKKPSVQITDVSNPIEIVIRVRISVEVPDVSDKEATSKALAAVTSDQLVIDEVDQTVLDVNLLILAILHNGTIKPADLQGASTLEDLGFTDDLLDFLHIALNNYVAHKNPGAEFRSRKWIVVKPYRIASI